MKHDNKAHSKGLYQNHCDLNVSHCCTPSTYSHDSKKSNYLPETLEKAEKALSHIPNNLERNDWFRIACALKSEFGEGAKGSFINWSENGKKSDRQNAKSTWKSAKAGNANIATLYYFARQHGYIEESKAVSKADYAKQQQAQAERKARVAHEAEKEKQEKIAEQQSAQLAINEIIPLLSTANANSTNYTREKQCDGKGAYTITRDSIQLTSTARKIYPFNDVKNDALVIPFQNIRGECVSMQCVYGGKKRIVKGSIKSGSYSYLNGVPSADTTDAIYIGEGYATVNTGMQADPFTWGVMAIDADNLPVVAKIIRQKHAYANIIILGDNDKSGVGQAKANEAGIDANHVVIPDWIDGQVKSTDINDVHVKQGIDKVKQLLNLISISMKDGATKPAKTEYQDCYIPDDVANCAVDLPVTNSDEKIVIIQSGDTTTKHLLNQNGNDYQKVTEIINGDNGYKKIICKRYLGGSVLKSSKKVKFLLVKSGMGTGKTTAMKKVIASLDKDACILFISPRKKLNLAIARDLGLSYYEDVKNETDKKVQARLARRMAITPQSLGAILKAHPSIKYEYVVLDESQAITKSFEASVTKDKLDTMTALKQACMLANHVIAMDAFLGKLTKGLVKELAGKEQVGELINTKKTWSDFTVDLVVGGKYQDRVNTANALQVESLNLGKVIYIASSSATYCDLREGVLKGSYKDLKILNITSKSKKEAEKILSNPDSIKEWDVIIGSPSIAVGVSFDIENHIDEVFGVFVNNNGTGDSEDSRQSLARPRKPIGKKWTIVLDEDRKVFNQVPRCPDDISKAIGDRIARAFFAGGVTPVAITEDEASVLRVVSMCQFERIKDKNNFNDIFLDSLVSDLGVTINEVSYNTVAEDKDDQKRTAEQKEEIEKRKIEIKTTSTRIDEVEANRTKALIKFKPNEVTQEMENSYERYKFESKFNINCDDLNKKEVAVYLEHENNGTISKLIAREQLFALKEFDKKYMKSRVVGRYSEDKVAFKVDMFDSKLNYPLFKSILKYALPYIDGREYSNSSLKKSQSLIRFIEKNYKEIVSLGVISLPKNWRKKPASLITKLFNLLGYEAKAKLVRGKGKSRTYTYTIKENDSVEALYERRKLDKTDWVTSTNEIMDMYDEIDVAKKISKISPMNLIKSLPEKLGVNYIEPAHVVAILKGFEKIPKHRQNFMAKKFIDIAVNDCIDVALESLKIQMQKQA